MTTPLHRPNPGDDERGPLPGGLYLPQLRPERSKCEVCGESTGSVHGKRPALRDRPHLRVHCAATGAHRRGRSVTLSREERMRLHILTAPPPEHTDEDAP